MSCVIRSLTADDADSLHELLTAYILEEHIAGSPIAPGPTTLRMYLDTFSALICGALPGAILVAENHGKVVGFTSLYLQPPNHDGVVKTAYSLLSYVLPEHRRNGIAREFIMHKERIALKLGATRISTTVRCDNKASLELVRGAGYNPRDVVLTKELR